MSSRGSPALSRRSAGVLLHLSSLAGPGAIGDLGKSAHEFVEWCADAGFSWWQMLPIGPVGAGNSPYSSRSSFAGEELFVSLEALADDGLLTAMDLAKARSRSRSGRSTVDYRVARATKGPAFAAAFRAFAHARGFAGDEYNAFARRTRNWLPGWRRFMGDRAGFHAFLQFQFDRQWAALRRTCHAHRVGLLGDLPIFASLDSADVMDHPSLFRLDRRGKPEVVTGVPPDCFSRNGQRWGHPHYRWSTHRRRGFAWWTERIAESLHRFDALRIDHFVGFHHAYEIPASEKTARKGEWKLQAGGELLAAARRRLGALPLVAEDLGAVTAEVAALRRRFGLPGMCVLQHSFGDDSAGARLRATTPATVVYTGTHDNDTSLGWWRDLDAAARARVARCGGAAMRRDPARGLCRLALATPAALAILPMQDLLSLGSETRMNRPGSARGNWLWRLPASWHRLKRADPSAISSMVRRARRAT